MSRNAAYEWRKDDADFAAEWEEAEQEAVDTLEQVAWDRASSGQSDRMLEILLKGHRPERYVERIKQELTGKDGGPVQMQVSEDADAFTSRIAGLAARSGEASEAGGTAG